MATNYNLPPNALPLGSIIHNPQFPDEILNQENIIPIDPQPTPVVHPNFKDKINNNNKGEAGFFARLTQDIEAGAEIGGSGDNTKSYDLKADKLETIAFYADPKYIDKALAVEDVRLYLGGIKYPPVYMVTGVKVARGATFATNTAKGRERHAKAGIFATTFGYPVNVGPSIEGSSNKSREVSFGGTSDAGSSADFVFAYRLRLITFEKQEDVWAHTSRTLLDGATHDDDSDSNVELVQGPRVIHDDEQDIQAAEKEWEILD